MKLSDRVIGISAGVALLVVILTLSFLFHYSHSVSLAAAEVKEIQPVRVAIEHLLTTIYDDFLLVEEYLLVDEYTDLANFESQLSHSQEQCELLTEEVEDLIILEKLTDEQAIEDYRAAILIYASWERSRNALLELHKESLATGAVAEADMQRERQRFVTLMQSSSAFFAKSLEEVNRQNVEKQRRLAERSSTVQHVLVGMAALMLLAIIGAAYVVRQQLARPLDEMSHASMRFTKGVYKTRVREGSRIMEIHSLQRQMNRVYSLIESTFTTKKARTEAGEHLLPGIYRDVIELVHKAALQGRTITITEVKKSLSLTHPTVASRLRYLEQNGYIEIKKEGRNKYIFEKS